jgi:crossover junction endonuclease EME1
MPEVISLLSSPPFSPVRATGIPTSRLSTSTLFNIDDFDSTGDIDFPTEQVAKRRKVSSPKPRRSPQRVKTSILAELDLSSEPDLPSPASAKVLLPVSNLFDAELELSSDLGCPSSSAPARPIASYAKVPDANDVEDIEFSSSAPARSKGKGKHAKDEQIIHILSSDDGNTMRSGDVLPEMFQLHTRSPAFSSTVMQVLASTKSRPSETIRPSQGPTKKVAASKPKSKSSQVLEDDIEVSSPPKPAKKEQSDKPRRDDSQTQEQRAAAKEAKAAAKESEKRRKREEKAEREKEKQNARDMADANKSKTNKKETSKEMILRLPASVEGTSMGNQVEEYMRQHEVEFSYSREEVDLSAGDGKSYPGKLIEWARKVQASYDEDEGHWVPLAESRVEPTDHVAVLLNAQEFASIAVGMGGRDPDPMPDLGLMKINLDRHVSRLRRHHKDRKLIYVLQGLHAWVKRTENAKNREYAAAVRAQVDAENATGAPTASQGRRKKQAKDSQHLQAVTADAVEDLQLYLQVNHQPLAIHHTTSPADTASQILSYTQCLSSRPYRIAELDHNLKSASFFMGTGSYKTGDTPEETFCRMLEGQQRVTPSIAQSIASLWPSPRELVAAFRASDNLMLENVRKSTNKDGGYSDKRIGPVISKRMWKVFLGRDPEATDGMS